MDIIMNRISEVINECLVDFENKEPVCIDEKLINEDIVQYGMDSIRFIKMVVLLEETFQCEIPDEKLIISEMNTLKKIYDVICISQLNKSLI